jgi:hypothetical protein
MEQLIQRRTSYKPELQTPLGMAEIKYQPGYGPLVPFLLGNVLYVDRLILRMLGELC